MSLEPSYRLSPVEENLNHDSKIMTNDETCLWSLTKGNKNVLKDIGEAQMYMAADVASVCGRIEMAVN